MPASFDITTAVRTALASSMTLREVRMFGGIGFMLNGNLASMVSKRGLLVRVGKDRLDKALAQPGARPMIMRGRPMQGYVFVDTPDLTKGGAKALLKLALAFVQTLPRKAPAAKSIRIERKTTKKGRQK
jgi:TfoX/Sxy family transcriptional regulator of competence genes